MSKLQEELYGGIYLCEMHGLKKSAKLLRKSAVKPGNAVYAHIKNMLSILSKLQKKDRHDNKIAILLGEEYLEFIDSLSSDFDLYLINPSSKLRKYCYKKRIAFGFSPLHIEHNFRELQQDKKTNRLKRRLQASMRELSCAGCRFMILPDDLEVIYRYYILAARKCGIQSAVIQHGIMGQGNHVLGTYADYFWVWGEKEKLQYQNKIEEGRVVNMGYPHSVRYDLMGNACHNRRMLFIGQHHGGREMEDAVRVVYKICMKHGWKFVYRPHPAERLDELKSIYADLKELTYSTTDLREDITGSEAVIGLFSTVLLEALIYGCNVIQIKSSRKGLDFSLMGDIQIVNASLPEIEESMLRAVEGKISSRLNPEWLYLNPDYAGSVKRFIQKQLV